MHPDTTILAATIHNDLSNAIVWSGKNGQDNKTAAMLGAIHIESGGNSMYKVLSNDLL
jgi:hypothetical protein